MAVDEFERLGARGLRRNRDDVGDHEIAHAGGDVAHIGGQGLLKAREDGVDAGVGVAAARGDVALFALGGLVGGVGDGRADRVRVGIFVADDVGGVGGGLGGGRHGSGAGRLSGGAGRGKREIKNPAGRAGLNVSDRRKYPSG